LPSAGSCLAPVRAAPGHPSVFIALALPCSRWSRRNAVSLPPAPLAYWGFHLLWCGGLVCPYSGWRGAAPPWLCQARILLGWSQGEAQHWQELLGFLSASWGCSLPCPAQAVVPAAACTHKGDLSLGEQQSSQLSQECDPGHHAAGNGHGLGPCQPAAAPTQGGGAVLSGWHCPVPTRPWHPLAWEDTRDLDLC